MQNCNFSEPCFRLKDGTARFRPAEMEAQLRLMKNYGTAFECRARKVSVDVRWRNCGRKMEIVVVGCAAWYSTCTCTLGMHQRNHALGRVLGDPAVRKVGARSKKENLAGLRLRACRRARRPLRRNDGRLRASTRARRETRSYVATGGTAE